LGSSAFPDVAHVRVAFSFSRKTAAPDRPISLIRLQLSETDRASALDLTWQHWTFEIDATGANTVGIATLDASR
jgi:hypothetical protein